MIIDEIILENFGAYRGKQIATMTPKKGRPIILFGGLNGGGKTTLLDAIQLCLYGQRAKLSNRGRKSYHDYLIQSINRGTDPADGASLVIRFRRTVDGEQINFELERAWRIGVKGLEESVRIRRNGLPDDLFTDHWDEVIQAYLPSSIAHLFFFDGEQIMELAEGGGAPQILGTAIHSLLGLNLVDRLEGDLKIFERKKREESFDRTAIERLQQTRRVAKDLDERLETLSMERGALVNSVGRLAKALEEHELNYRREGGETYLRKKEIESKLVTLTHNLCFLESELRKLVSGPLPLRAIATLLAAAEAQRERERKIKTHAFLKEVFEQRDEEIVELLRASKMPGEGIEILADTLKADRERRLSSTTGPVLLNADDELGSRLAYARANIVPTSHTDTLKLLEQIAEVEEQIGRMEFDLSRVPPEERIHELQTARDKARLSLEEKQSELRSLESEIAMVSRQRAEAEESYRRITEEESMALMAEDDRARILRHSERVRATIANFRTTIVQRHVSTIASLMLDSFQQLLRKSALISRLEIDPASFQPHLFGTDGKPIAIERLSAGERQLLATSMLWGLARVSGRPIPIIIDTPLGRLDSQHRRNLVRHYFPNASHQVVLLSTDEEIAGESFEALKPYTTHTYLINHDEAFGATNIIPGYFK